MNLHFEARLTEQDFIAAQRLHVGWGPFAARCAAAAILVAAVGLALGSHDAGSWAGAATIYVLWLWIFSNTYPRAVARRASRIFAAQKNLDLTYDVTITEERLVIRHGDGTWTIPWRDCRAWRQGRGLVLVYQYRDVFRIFPRRWFASDADFAAFQGLLARTIGPAHSRRARAGG